MSYFDNKLNLFLSILTFIYIMGLISWLIDIILLILYKILSIIGDIFLFVNFDWMKRRIPLPPIGSRILLTLSTTEIAQKIRNHEVSVEEVIRCFIERIREVNPIINSLVCDRFELAIQEAKEMDRRLETDLNHFGVDELEIKYPLYGIPFTVKDAFSVKGIYHTAGLWDRRFIRALHDSDVVKHLRAAGGIPLGVTNMSELGMWWESANTIYGRSSNPYDNRHTVGGSSGGEAGLQASSGSCFGIGSDVGGSVRIPAFFTGIFGHKPTPGLISPVGQEPRASGRIREYSTVGTFVRHPIDLGLIFNIIIEDDKKSKLKPITEIKKLKIYYMIDDNWSPLITPLSPIVKASLINTLDLFERKYNIKPKKVQLNGMVHSLGIWINAMSSSGSFSFCEELGMRRRKVNPYWEFVKYLFGLSPHTFPSIVLGIFEKFAKIATHFPLHKNLNEIERSLLNELEELLKDDCILIYPSHPTTAPRHKRPIFSPFDFSYGAVFNIIGLPAIQIPLGLSENGLPIGVQIASGKYNDLTLIEIAKEFNGKWISPS